ncbi:MAG: DNA repair protein RecO [Clostridiaceae bacterium]|nr:DNA repair protein RecO [Clostridiaceae bacterium]
MNITAEGIILRAVNYKESDKILTVLTKERGKITVKAAGSRRKGSRLSSGTQLFCYSELSLFEKDGRFTLDDSYIKAQFYGLCADIEKMALASYFSQVLMAEPEEGTGDGEVLRLALNSFYALEKGIFPQPVIKAAFELRYMALCGYSPDISCCPICGSAGTGGYINTENGTMICQSCAGDRPFGGIFLDEEAVEAARYILSCDMKRLFSFNLPTESLKRLVRFCEEYLLDKTEQGYKALDFYKSLFKQEE